MGSTFLRERRRYQYRVTFNPILNAYRIEEGHKTWYRRMKWKPAQPLNRILGGSGANNTYPAKATADAHLHAYVTEEERRQKRIAVGRALRSRKGWITEGE